MQSFSMQFVHVVLCFLMIASLSLIASENDDLIVPIQTPCTQSHEAGENAQFCSTNENNDKTECDNQPNQSLGSKYNKNANNPEWTKFHELIQEAELQYNSTLSPESECNNSSCSCYFNQIQQDLEPFQTSGITKAQIELARKRGTLYQIINHKLYREPECKFPARCAGIEHFLLEILDQVADLEFVINVSDYPQVSRRIWELEGDKAKLPIFSFSKTPEYLDILYPAWSFWDGGPSISIFPRGLGRWDLLRESLIQASKATPWRSKLSQGFFRGSRTSAERDSLIRLSLAEPELVDAKYTKNQAWRSEADTLGQPAAREVSLESHCKYKYLFNYRGVAASFRFKHLFLCRSAVFHVGNEWVEFFYAQLQPWIHFVPVPTKNTEAELKVLVQWAKEHDSQVETIANRGFEFIKAQLRLEHVGCYWEELLERCSKLQKYPIELRPGFMEIRKQIKV